MIEITQDNDGFITICKFIPNHETLDLTDFRITALLICASINSLNINQITFL